jgi:hypothetical protein
MPLITQVSNANAIWSGTIPADAAGTGITSYRLYCAQNAEVKGAYRLVTVVANPGVGVIALGPLRYADLFLITPTRPFYLRAVAMIGNQEQDLMGAASPALTVTPSTIKGWSLEQLLEQDVRPVMIVGYNVANNTFYPINVVPGAGGGFKIE